MNTRPLLLALLLACGGDKEPADTAPTEADADTDTDSDADADTDTDTDADTDTTPAEAGFELDGGWYPLVEGSVYCDTVTGIYTIRGGANRDGSGTQANAYAYFDGVPEPGTYTVEHFDLDVPPEGSTGIGFIDYRDTTYWYSDGKAGTLEVVDVGGGELEVRWSDVTLYGLFGGAQRTTASGTLRCAP